MADRDAVMKKIQGLLTLSENAGASAHEAETAANLAAVLMAKHAIDGAAVEAAREAEGHKVPPAPNGFSVLETQRRRVTWTGRLANQCAQVNGCDMYWNWTQYGYEIRIVGPETDRDMTEALYHLLHAQVNRFAKQALGDRTFKNNFRLGMVSRLGQRLKQGLREAEDQARAACTGSALVVVGNAIQKRQDQRREVRVWLESQVGKLAVGKASKAAYDARGYDEGQSAGNRATLRNDRLN
ncbi:MAG: DUF2786 domain-containing protein [bacterium]|nr:DUF2786 domain-containing protein [bacterium]